MTRARVTRSTLVSLSLRLKDLLGPVTRVKKRRENGGAVYTGGARPHAPPRGERNLDVASHQRRCVPVRPPPRWSQRELQGRPCAFSEVPRGEIGWDPPPVHSSPSGPSEPWSVRERAGMVEGEGGGVRVRRGTREMLDGGIVGVFTCLEDPAVKVRTRQDAPHSQGWA